MKEDIMWIEIAQTEYINQTALSYMDETAPSLLVDGKFLKNG